MDDADVATPLPLQNERVAQSPPQGKKCFGQGNHQAQDLFHWRSVFSKIFGFLYSHSPDVELTSSGKAARRAG
jgi:hypothetical protein